MTAIPICKTLHDKALKAEKYINSISLNNFKIALTETIPTKFPEQEVKMMDMLIQRGMVISRSDLIREAAREKIKGSMQAKTYGDVLVKKMKEEGDFNRIEWKTLVNVYLNPKFNENSMNEAEKKAVRKLLRDPMGLLKRQDKRLIVTSNGQ